MSIDRSRAFLTKEGFTFEPFRPKETDSKPLKDMKADDNLELLVFERGGIHRALIVREMAYHHVCQGELAGEPYLLSFWAPCNSGVGLTPIVAGKVHCFGAAGLVNGLFVMADEETRTYWDHITGEAFEGSLTGQQLDVWGVEMTTVKAALINYPDIELYKSNYRSLKKMFFNAVNGKKIEGGSSLPPGFRDTMSKEIDPRLPEMEQGLGVIIDNIGKFYPMKAIAKGTAIEDSFMGQTITVDRSALDGVLFARSKDTGEAPMQLLTRWYGFSFTYPDCDIFG